ncbi:MAG TPA: DUF3429 domain-containing protein [Rhodopila sp.]|nr:DUF3429 domain-containing protein [Rhodopila sp.]
MSNSTDRASTDRAAPPPSVTAYGLLGLIPFLAPPLVFWALPGWSPFASRLLALYGGLILSFLGGARWGLANARPAAPAGVISLSMLPTLVGLALLLLPADLRRIQLAGLAVALAAQWVWDITAADMPRWYPWLRSILSAGAIVGLIAGAALATA